MKRIRGKVASLVAVLFSLIFVPVVDTEAQIICDISIDTPMPVCPNSSFELSIIGFVEPSYVFNWQKEIDGVYVTVGTDTVLSTSNADSATYKVIVVDTITHDTCWSEPFGVSVYPIISIDIPMPVCPDIYFELSVFEEPNLTFDWQKKEGNTYVSVGDESIYGTRITDSTVFKVIVIDTITMETCESEPFGVSVHQQIIIEFDQTQLTCTNGDTAIGNTARVRAIATGEFPTDDYHYFWEVPPIHIAPGDSAVALDLKAHLNYSIIVRDNHGCPKYDTIWTEAYDNPEVEIFPDTARCYLQNPYITYSYVNLSEDSLSISNHFWWFQDSIPDPDYTNTSDLLDPTFEYSAVGDYIVMLTVYNEQGCDTIFTKMAEVRPVKLYIPNVFTPETSPGVNDKFEITIDPPKEADPDETLLNYYKSSYLVIFNRMGRTVFEAENYDNSWDGDNLPDGVYYFVLECHGAKSTDIFKGSVTILRGN